MYNYSMRFQQLLGEDKRNFIIKLKMEVRDIYKGDVTYELSNEDIWEEGLSVDSATSITNEFTVGGLVSSKLSAEIINDEQRFSDIDFIDGRLTLWVGMDVDGVLEMEQYGVYTISDAKVAFERISIEALDNLSKLAHDYETGIAFPTSATNIIRNSCNACGVVLDASSIPKFLDNYKIADPPGNSTITYASLVSYCAQIAGCYVHADHNGRLALDWYALHLMNEKEDGGTFQYDGLTEEHEPESQLDGGSFDNGTPSYKSGDEYDGGTFRDASAYHVINDLSTMEVDTDDVVITGVKVTSMPVDLDVEADTTMLGVEGYVIEINQNPLIQAGQSGVVAQQLFNILAGMRFRPLNASIFPTPMIEAGDVGLVSDYNGNYYTCFFSTVRFSPDTHCSIACDAQSANRQSNSMQSALAQVLNQAKQWVAYEKNARENAYEQMAQQIANASGFYETSETKYGATIKYFHNKPRLEDSAIVWKLTAETMSVSTDGGKTWNAAIAANGDAIMNTISAYGINADWINTGILQVGGRGTSSDAEIIGMLADNTIVFRLDKDGLYTKDATIEGGMFHVANNSSTENGKSYITISNYFSFDEINYNDYETSISDNGLSVYQSVPGSKGRFDVEGNQVYGSGDFVNIMSNTGSYAYEVIVNGTVVFEVTPHGDIIYTGDFYRNNQQIDATDIIITNKNYGQYISGSFDSNGTYPNLTAGYLTYDGAKIVEISDQNNFRPTSAGIYTCGTQGYYWKNCWSDKFNGKEYNGFSDRRLKHDIEPLNEKYHLLTNELKQMACRFKFDNAEDKYRTGFIAQEIEDAIKRAGLSVTDFGGLTLGKDNIDDEDGIYQLAYDDFIALLFNELRLQDEKIASLEDRLSKLEKEVLNNGN